MNVVSRWLTAGLIMVASILGMTVSPPGVVQMVLAFVGIAFAILLITGNIRRRNV